MTGVLPKEAYVDRGYRGHMKNDGRLGRNFLKGEAGDAINALLCGAGHNLRKILRQLALLCAYIWQQLLRLRQQSDSNDHQQLMAFA